MNLENYLSKNDPWTSLDRGLVQTTLANHGRPWPAMTDHGHGWTWPYYGWPLPAMAGHGRQWPAMAGHGRPRPAMAGQGRPWPQVLLVNRFAGSTSNRPGPWSSMLITPPHPFCFLSVRPSWEFPCKKKSWSLIDHQVGNGFKGCTRLLQPPGAA